MKNVKLEDIKKYVEICTGIDDISKKDRSKGYTYARALYYKLASENTYQSLVKIGKYLGKNHASVLHGMNKIYEEATIYQDDILIYYNNFKKKISEDKTKEQLETENEILMLKIKILENKLGYNI